MNEESSLEENEKTQQFSLFNYLINYLTENRNRNRNTTTIRINKQVHETFYLVCHQLGFKQVNVALEGLLQSFNDQYSELPIQLQTTLHGSIPTNHKKQQIVSRRLELKLIRRDLGLILTGLEKRTANATFLESRLRQLLPKAIRLHERTLDTQLQDLLEKAEKWVG